MNYTTEQWKQMSKRVVRHKFNAVRTERDGIKFSSKAEARHYDENKLAVKGGVLLFFLMQVPIHLPGGVKYVVDFVEFYANGEVKFVDVKGQILPMFVLKRKQVEALYPITIQVVK